MGKGGKFSWDSVSFSSAVGDEDGKKDWGKECGVMEEDGGEGIQIY